MGTTDSTTLLRNDSSTDGVCGAQLVVCVCAERIRQTVSTTKRTVSIEEKGVKLRLSIVDTPGFGDAVDNTQRSVRNARRGGASPPFDARFPARQLEAAAGLRGAAVGSVLPRRERPGPPQHPRRPRALLPLLHLAVRPRVRGRPGGVEALPSQGPASIRVCVRACSLRPVDVECMRALHDKVNLLPLLAKADSLTPDELRKKKLKVGGGRPDR